MTRYTADVQSLSMQREALRRVRERQEHARQALGAPPPAAPGTQAEAPPAVSAPQGVFNERPREGPFAPLAPEEARQERPPGGGPSPQRQPQGQGPAKAPLGFAQRPAMGGPFGLPFGQRARNGNAFGPFAAPFGAGAGNAARSAPAMPPAAPNAAREGAPPRRDLRGLLDSFLKREGPGGESLSALGGGLKDTIGAVAEPAERLLDSLGIGGEELIILMVMYTVFREKGDKTLLLALGYLLL